MAECRYLCAASNKQTGYGLVATVSKLHRDTAARLYLSVISIGPTAKVLQYSMKNSVTYKHQDPLIMGLNPWSPISQSLIHQHNTNGFHKSERLPPTSLWAFSNVKLKCCDNLVYRVQLNLQLKYENAFCFVRDSMLLCGHACKCAG